jgi:hypothetical protein
MSECGNPPRLSSDERQAARSALHRALFGTELGVHFGRLMRELDACAAELADTKAMLARGVEFVEEDAQIRALLIGLAQRMRECRPLLSRDSGAVVPASLVDGWAGEVDRLLSTLSVTASVTELVAARRGRSDPGED